MRNSPAGTKINAAPSVSLTWVTNGVGVTVGRVVAVSVGVFEEVGVFVGCLVGISVRVEVGVSNPSVTPAVGEVVGVEIAARGNASEALFEAFNNHHTPPNMISNAAITPTTRQRVHLGARDFPVTGQNLASNECSLPQ